MSNIEKYQEIFFQESFEHIQLLNDYLIKLESEPNNTDYLNALFRSVHTLKGMAATMGYAHMKELAIIMEEKLDKVRQDTESVTSLLINLFFEGVDMLRLTLEDKNKKMNLDQYIKHLENPSQFKKLCSPLSIPSSRHTNFKAKTMNLDSLVPLVYNISGHYLRLERMLAKVDSEEIHEQIKVIRRSIDEIQDQITAMQQISADKIFGKFSETVRNLSNSLGKNIRLEIDDNEIILDRAIWDVTIPSLIHILRNAVDHGIETPALRKKAGKPIFGTIRLSTSKTDNMIIIVISDDGKGIDLDAIKTRALRKGIISQAESEKMSYDKIISLIGTPGLSTADIVTDISGRGVGMDVVRTQIRNAGGKVKIRTEKGKGTTITLAIPTSQSKDKGGCTNTQDKKFGYCTHAGKNDLHVIS